MDHFLSGLNAAAARCQTGFTPISDGTGNAFCIDPAVLSTLEHAAGNVLVKTQKKRARLHGLSAVSTQVQQTYNQLKKRADDLKKVLDQYQKSKKPASAYPYPGGGYVPVPPPVGYVPGIPLSGLGDDGTNTLIKLGALGIAGYIAWKWLKGGRKR